MSVYDKDGIEIANLSENSSGGQAPDYSALVGMVFDKALFIGDSLTYGLGAKDGVAAHAYPAQLAKITGLTAINTGLSGSNPKTWYASKWDGLASSDTGAGLCIIEFGTNNGLTRTVAADTASGDYTTYADTTTGWYCRIIEELQAANDKIFIVLSISPNLNITTATATIGAINDIAEKYGLPVIDLHNTHINLMSPEYKQYPNAPSDPHLNNIGYALKATEVARMLGQIIINKADDICQLKGWYTTV